MSVEVLETIRDIGSRAKVAGTGVRTRSYLRSAHRASDVETNTVEEQSQGISVVW
jgi:hypothetical protein